MPAPDALLLYSGGIDSTHALYRRVLAGHATRVHHVALSNRMGRRPFEARAVRLTLDWFTANGYGHLIEYTESGFDYGDISTVAKDHNIWGLTAGLILRETRSKGISKVIRTVHSDSTPDGPDSPAWNAALSGWVDPITRLVKRDIEYVYPQVEMTKADIVADLPEDLLRLTWYCRRPKRAKPCHVCFTCQQVDEARKGSHGH